MNRRGTWLLTAGLLAAVAVYIFTREGSLAKGSALWAIGFSLLALSQARTPRSDVDAGQGAADKELLRLTLMAGVLGLLFLGWAVFADGAAAGIAIFCLGIAFLLAVPTVMAYRGRDSGPPEGASEG